MATYTLPFAGKEIEEKLRLVDDLVSTVDNLANTSIIAGDNTMGAENALAQKVTLTEEQIAEGLTENITYAANTAAFGISTTAGSMGYRILDFNNIGGTKIDLVNNEPGYYVLDAANGVPEITGYEYSILLQGNSERHGIITSVDGNKVYVDKLYITNAVIEAIANAEQGDSTALEEYLASAYIKFPDDLTIGELNIGQGAFSCGYKTEANEIGSFASGFYTAAKGKYSHAEGNNTIAIGESTHAEGYGNKAIGNYSHAQGMSSYSEGEGAHAEGYVTHASGNYSHSEGQKTYATQSYAHSEGRETRAEGWTSHSEGSSTVAKGNHSHAEGGGNISSGTASHAEGNNTESAGNYSHSEGRSGVALGESSHIEGGSYYSALVGYNKFAEAANLDQIESISEPSIVQWEKAWNVPDSMTGKAPEWRFALAYGKNTHAEGENSLALGAYSHSEGQMNITKGWHSHAEGVYNTTVGSQSHAEGGRTTTLGTASHTEGNKTVSFSNHSHAEGLLTSAGGYLVNANFMTGNALGYDEDNNFKIGSLSSLYASIGDYVLLETTYNTKWYSNHPVVARVIDYKDSILTVQNSGIVYAEGGKVRVYSLYTGVTSENYNTVKSNIEDKLCSQLVLNELFIGNESSELLITTTGSYYYSARVISADWSNSTSTIITINRCLSEISSDLSKVKVYIAIPSKSGMHAEGYGTWAKGKASHAEGFNTITEGDFSHTEGKYTKTIGEGAHAEGLGTIADDNYSTVVGYYNLKKEDTNSTDANPSLFVVGNGSRDSARSDALRVFKDGTIEVANSKLKFLPDGTIQTPYVNIDANFNATGTPNKEWINEQWILLGDSLTASNTINGEVENGNYQGFNLESGRTNSFGGFTVTSYLPITAGTFSFDATTNDSNTCWFDNGDGTLLCEDGSTATIDYNTGVVEADTYMANISNISYQYNLNLADKHYFELIADKTGITIDNRAISGTGYMRQSDESASNTSGSAANAFWNVASSIPYDKSSSPIVTIFGSGNDLLHYSNLGSTTDTSTSTICGCINKTLNNIYSRLPLARVCVVTPTPWKGSTPDKTSGQMAAYVDKLIEICRLRGIPCLDLFHESGLRPDDAFFRELVYAENAGCHLNEIGHKLIAPRFKAMLDNLII